MTPYLIFALPRSRTFWLSQFLSHRDWVCGHDEQRHVRSVEDVRSWLRLDRVGSVETAPFFWKLARQIRPDVKLLVVRRPIEQVVRSVLRTGVVFDRARLLSHLQKSSRYLSQIEDAGALVFDYARLSDENTCKRLYEHCLPYAHDHERWQQLDKTNLQINFPAMINYVRAYAPQLRQAERACVRQIKLGLRDATVRCGQPDKNGISIQEESLRTFMRDGQALFEEHCKAVGEAPDEWTRKNIPMIQVLEDGGYWQFVTARSNGRMLGYLQTLIGPSLEKKGRISGTQALFFVSQDAVGLGLGMKLQRASIEALRARGVNEIFMRQGVRGSGPRLGVLFQRLGAEEFGQLYKLQLKAS